MHKLWMMFIFLTLASCQSRVDREKIALITERADGLIASEMIPFTNFKSELTKEDLNRLDRYYPATLERINKNEHLQLIDIINLTRSGVADEVITELIDSTNSLFFLSSQDITELTQAGVSKKVISTMNNTTDSQYEDF